ncbi:prepilin peptidase [Paenibacillus koleovorans]|uniref:prepilin peptidase n=1 Tax=Paenibacillus koleovorans TaxID=121608 RepID=UPI0013E383D0|nr:A24 family peptidase [Paenibacillus koleovorans]
MNEASIAVLWVLLVAAFIQDALQSKIGNLMTVPAAAIGIGLAALNEVGSLADAAGGLVVGFAGMLVLYAIGAVGAGDVKLFGAIGALTGVQFVMYGMMNAIVCAAVVAIAIWLWRGEAVRRLRNMAAVIFGVWIWRDIRYIRTIGQLRPMKFPFMYAVLPAIGITWFQIRL